MTEHYFQDNIPKFEELREIKSL